MINSVYGKTMEKLRERKKNVRLVNNAKDYKKYVSKTIFLVNTLLLFRRLNQSQHLINQSM